MGPRHLFFRTEKIDEVAKFFVENLNGEITDFWQGSEKASENSSLCYITGINHGLVNAVETEKIVLINDASTIILATIINSQVCHLINRVDMGPASIVMRVAGNESKLIEKVKERFSGKEVGFTEGIRSGSKDDTLIAFTNKTINGPVSPNDLLDTKLLIPRPIREVQGILRLEALRLITQCLSDSQWYELRINIYDSNGKYEENYNRLIYILSKLEIGMILGESWTKDHAVLFSVLTYQVRLFTFSTPEEIKKILMALEYTMDGKRLVDFDLHYKNKKIYWSDIFKSKKRKNKVEMAINCRKSLYEKLSQEDIETLENMEKMLI